MTANFKILFNDEIAAFAQSPKLKAATNKHLISLANDYEDSSWMSSKFEHYIWDNVALTALSKQERDALAGKSKSQLAAAAKNLRLTDKDTIGGGSEIAEIVLYGLMQELFNALPVVPKIFYKQNAQDNAKGADGVHIVLHGTDFTLRFGEAKFYNSISDSRLDKVVDSVLESLRTDKLKKENSIITNVAELDNLGIEASLVDRIKTALDPQDSIDGLKKKIRIPILLLHECKITASSKELTKEYRDELRLSHSERAEAYFSKQIMKSHKVFKYADITFHLILFPVPSKKPIVESFLKETSFHRGG